MKRERALQRFWKAAMWTRSVIYTLTEKMLIPGGHICFMQERRMRDGVLTISLYPKN